MRYEKRGERPPWPGLEAWRQHPQRQLRAWAAVGLQRLLPAPLGLPLCLPRSASPSALATSCFSSCPLPCSLVGSHQRSQCSMFTKRPAHSGALHRTYRRRTRVHVPPMKQAASNELTAGQLATAVAAGSPQAPQPAPSRRPDLCRGLAHQQQHPAHPTAGRPPGRIEAGYNTNPSPQGAGTSPLLPMEPSGSLWWRCWLKKYGYELDVFYG